MLGLNFLVPFHFMYMNGSLWSLVFWIFRSVRVLSAEDILWNMEHT